MSDPRAAAALALALSLAACASGSGDRPRDQGFTGDELLAAGDFDGATRLYRREIDESGGGDAELREKLANASVRAASAHAAAALTALEAGDVDLAAAKLKRADGYAPGLPIVRDAHAKIDARVAANAKAALLRGQAKSTMATDPAESARLLAEADAAAPGGGDASRMRREANLRAEADRSAERAEAAWAAGDRATTARELAGAQVGGRPTARAEELRGLIAHDLVVDSAKCDDPQALRSALEFADAASLNPTVVSTLRDRLVEKLLAAARDLADTRRPATAALIETEAKRLRADAPTPSLDRVRDAATTTILVRAFEDGTGGKVDGAALARALRERINLDAAGGGTPVVAFDDSDAARAAHPGALVATGRVLSARQVAARLGAEDVKVRYRVGSRRAVNPEVDVLARRVEEATAAARVAETDQLVAAAALGDLQIAGRGTSDAAMRARIASAKTRADEADAALQRARDAEAALRNEAKTVAREVDDPVYAERFVPVTTKTKTAQLSARVTLSLGVESVFAQDVSAAAEHKETISDGFAPAGVPPDPDDTPDDASMAAKAADRFAALAAGGVRAAADAGPRRRLEAARAAERAGRRDEAAEGYAMYLLSTADVASAERADAARALEQLLGVHVALRTSPWRDPR